MTYKPKQRADNSVSITERYPWVKIAYRREQMISDYIDQFKGMSTIYREAVAGGYDLDLLRYIHAIASLQAQMICGEHAGWDSVAVFGAGTVNADQVVKNFLYEQERQAQTGHIEVAVPTGRVEKWKQSAEWKKNFQMAKESKRDIATAKCINPGLDEFLKQRRI